jgi:hypothetical protein
VSRALLIGLEAASALPAATRPAPLTKRHSSGKRTGRPRSARHENGKWGTAISTVPHFAEFRAVYL